MVRYKYKSRRPSKKAKLSLFRASQKHELSRLRSPVSSVSQSAREGFANALRGAYQAGLSDHEQSAIITAAKKSARDEWRGVNQRLDSYIRKSTHPALARARKLLG